MSTTLCANCGLPVSGHVYRHANGKAYCCRGCAERTLCRCRLSVVQYVTERARSELEAQASPAERGRINESNQPTLITPWTDQDGDRQDPRRIA